MAATLTLEEMAASAFRAWAYAGGVEEEPQWDHLALDDQLQWMALAKKFEPLAQEMEGRSYFQVAMKVAEVWFRSDDPHFWQSLSERSRWIWQAVTRHLMALIDSDDNEGPGALERSWGEWVESKLKGEP